MPADADEHLRKTDLRRLGEIDDFGDVRQIVAGEGDDVRPPALDHSEIGALVLDLEIDKLDLMPRPPCRLGDEFKADRCDGSGCLDSFRGEYAKAGCRLKVSPSPESNSYRVVAVVQ
jgi:hypothetical protein